MSASHDSTVKVWDMRANVSLHTLAAHDGEGAVRPLGAQWPHHERGIRRQGQRVPARRAKAQPLQRSRTLVLRRAEVERMYIMLHTGDRVHAMLTPQPHV